MSNYKFTELENKFMEYILDNNVKGVCECISQGVDVNCHDDCDSPLALSFGKPEILLHLLAAGADPELVVKLNDDTCKSVLNDFGYLIEDACEKDSDQLGEWLKCLRILKNVVDFNIPRHTYYDGKKGIDQLIKNSTIRAEVEHVILAERVSWSQLFKEIFPDNIPEIASFFLKKELNIIVEACQYKGKPASRIVNTEAIVRRKLSEYKEPSTYADAWIRTYIQMAKCLSPDQIPAMGVMGSDGITIECGDFYFYGQVTEEDMYG